MLETEKLAFIEILRPKLKVCRIEPDGDVYAEWWSAMEPFPLQLVEAALSRFMRNGDGFLLPSKIVNIMHDLVPDGRPTADEAWGIALSGMDESATIITNDEIQESMRAARTILEAGDEVGARMAFKGAYERITRLKRGNPVRWYASYGTNPDGRLKVVSEAVERGLLPRSALTQLPAPGSYVERAISGGNLLEFKMTEEQRERNKRGLRMALEKSRDKDFVAMIEKKLIGCSA